MNPTANEYEVQGRDVARKLGLEIRAAYQGNQCPGWGGSKPTTIPRYTTAMDCPECGGIHGDKYRVTIKRVGRTGPGSALHFDFWASWSDCFALLAEVERMTPQERVKRGWPRHEWSLSSLDRVVGTRGRLWLRRKHTPTEYTILACVSSDMSCPTDADEVHAEFGDMRPSQAEAIAAHARKLQAFFTEEERAILSEVQ